LGDNLIIVQWGLILRISFLSNSNNSGFILDTSSVWSSSEGVKMTDINPISIDSMGSIQYHVYGWRAWASYSEQYPRCLHPKFISQGWTATLNDKTFYTNGMSLIEQDKQFKPEGIIVHLPFGHKPYSDFDFFGLTSCRKDPRLVKVCDIQDFINAWLQYSQMTGIKKILFYYGYIGADSAYAGLTDDRLYELVIENVSPVLSLKRCGLETGIIIDTASIKAVPDKNWTLALPYLKSMGLHYGQEAWPPKSNAMISDPQCIFVATDNNLWWMDPSNDPTNTWAATNAEIKGPMIPILISASGGDLNAIAQSGKDLLKKYNYLAYPNWIGTPLTARDLFPVVITPP
jgi:hypothetical protein